MHKHGSVCRIVQYNLNAQYPIWLFFLELGRENLPPQAHATCFRQRRVARSDERQAEARHLPDFTGKSEWTIAPDVVASHPSNRNGVRMNGQRCE